MTAEERGKFLFDLMYTISSLQLAVQITSLPDHRFAEVISVLASRPDLMASIISWMTPLGRLRVASVISVSALGEVYASLTESDRKRMNCPILFDWVKAAQKTSDEKWKYGVGYVPGQNEWTAKTDSDRVGLALRMNDGQLDELQENLK